MLDSNNPAAFASELFKNISKGGGGSTGKKEKRKMTVSEARPVLEETIAEQMLEDFDVVKEAIVAVEESGEKIDLNLIAKC